MEKEGIVKYKSRDGQDLALSMDIVKKYLVSGNATLITGQEIMYFLGVCKSRGLNPFKKDCYLVKYDSSPAAIITSIDYFRSRARSQADCKGWKKGIILLSEDGKVKDSLGLILKGETLIGGFFEARPAGWDETFRLEVNLKGYVKKTKGGDTTQFWQADKQPTMIAKVAEAQGLRTIWPDEFQGLYQDGEIQEPPIDIEQIQEVHKDALERFRKFLAAQNISPETSSAVEDFCKKSATIMDITETELKCQAANDLNTFWSEFRKWHGKNKKPEASTKTSLALLPAENPAPTGNWWDADKHWKFLKKDSIMQIVRLGAGVESRLDATYYPGVEGTLQSASPENLKTIALKYDKAVGINGAFSELLLTASGVVEETTSEDNNDSDMEEIERSILDECLSKIKKFPEDIITAARADIGASVGAMPTAVDGANRLIDACKKIEFAHSAGLE